MYRVQRKHLLAQNSFWLALVLMSNIVLGFFFGDLNELHLPMEQVKNGIR